MLIRRVMLIALIAGAAFAHGLVDETKLLVDLSKKLDEPSARGYHSFSLSDGDQAKDTLVRIGKPAIPLLLNALKSTDLDARYYAAQALGEIGTSAHYDAVLKAYFAEPESKWFYLEPLGRLGGQQAVSVILQAVKEPPGHETSILRGLAATKSPSALPFLERALASEGYSFRGEKQAAADGLAGFGDAGIKILIQAFDAGDRQAGIALSAVNRPDVHRALLAALKDPVRRRTVFIHPPPGGPEFCEVYREMVRSKDMDVMRNGISFLTPHLKAQDIPFLEEALLQVVRGRNSDNTYSQLLAIDDISETLIRLNARSACPTIRTAVTELEGREDIDARSRMELLRLLVKFRDLGAEAVFLRNVFGKSHEDEYSGGRTDVGIAAQGCGMVGFRTLSKLAEAHAAGKLANDPYASALWATTDPKCLPIVKEALKSDSDNVCRAAYAALGNMKSPEVDEYLFELMKEDARAPAAAMQLALKGHPQGLALALDFPLSTDNTLYGDLAPAFRSADYKTLRRALGVAVSETRMLCVEELLRREETSPAKLLKEVFVEKGSHVILEHVLTTFPKLRSEALEAANQSPDLWVRTVAYLAAKEGSNYKPLSRY